MNNSLSKIFISLIYGIANTALSSTNTDSFEFGVRGRISDSVQTQGMEFWLPTVSLFKIGVTISTGKLLNESLPGEPKFHGFHAGIRKAFEISDWQNVSVRLTAGKIFFGEEGKKIEQQEFDESEFSIGWHAQMPYKKNSLLGFGLGVFVQSWTRRNEIEDAFSKVKSEDLQSAGGYFSLTFAFPE